MTTTGDRPSREWPDEAEADPADVAEQQTLAVDDGREPASQVGDIGEADAADVYEQAVPVPTDEDGWDRG